MKATCAGVVLAATMVIGPLQASAESDSAEFVWQARCEVAVASARKKCTIARGPVGFVLLERAGIGMFCGAGLSFPGAVVAARVDANTPYEWTNGTHPPRKMEMLVAEARGGKILSCREPKWPTGVTELEAALDGFAAAMNEAERFIAAE